MYYVYILECEDGSYYTGITTDLHRRFKEHLAKKGGAYTRTHKPIKIAYSEACNNRSEALKRELEIKRWRRNNKGKLVKSVMVRYMLK